MEYRVSYYDVLNVTPQSSDEEVKQAYRKLALRFHPDRNPADRAINERRFRLINEAYSNLKTREKRVRYNRQLRAQNDNRPDPSWVSQIANIFWPAKDTGSQG